MKWNATITLRSLVIGGALLLPGTAAEGRTIPANAGQFVISNGNGCMTPLEGGVYFISSSTCQGSQWSSALPVDTATSYSPFQEVYLNGGNSLYCRNCAWSPSSHSWSCTQFVSSGFNSGYLTLSPGSVTVPPNGLLESSCYQESATNYSIWYGTGW
jgi:hypothetical protein